MNVVQRLREINFSLTEHPWSFGWKGEADDLEAGCCITALGLGGVCDAVFWKGNDEFNERNRKDLELLAELRNLLPRIIDVLDSKNG